MLLLILFTGFIHAIKKDTAQVIADVYDRYTKKTCRSHKANPEIESFVRSIAQEMKIDKFFEVYAMDDDLVKELGSANVIVIGNIFFIGPRFEEALTLAEKRFLIGHELAHFENDHYVKNLAAGAGLLVGYFGIVRIIQNSLTDKIEEPLRSLTTGLVSTPFLALTYFGYKVVERYHEYQADKNAALKLGEADGGISLLTRHAEPLYKPNYTNLLTRLCANHPSSEQRVSFLQELKRKNNNA